MSDCDLEALSTSRPDVELEKADSEVGRTMQHLRTLQDLEEQPLRIAKLQFWW